jgi:hypothetical protein
MDGYILYKQLMLELRLTPGFLEYHCNIGGIPAPEKFGQNRIYSPAAADQIRDYVKTWADRPRKYRTRTTRKEGN